MDYAKIYPVIAFEATGSFSRLWIFKQYKKKYWGRSTLYPPTPFRLYQVGNPGRVITKYYYPYNPRSVAQQTNRNWFAYAVYNWHYLSSQAKYYYDHLSKPVYAYGIHRYIQLYMLTK